VICVAEATLDLITPWAESGKLPTFHRLANEGASASLRSQIPINVPQLWGTLVTGRSPGHHGLFDFWQRGPDGIFREINSSHIQSKTIWNIATENGLRSGIVNIPIVYPPEEINGFMISGEVAPGAHRSIAYPSSVYDEVVNKFGRYRLKDIFPGGRQKSDYLGLIEEDISTQTDVLEYLITEKEWDFFFTFYSATAIAQHYFWSDMETKDENNPHRGVIETAYRCIDAALGRLIDRAGPDTTVFVISECGAGPLYSGVQINTWLEREGFLTRKRKSSGTSIGSAPLSSIQHLLRRIVAQSRKDAQRLLPKSTFYWMNHYMKSVKVWIQTYLSSSDIDWSRTKAFSRGKEGNIYINLRGRDPHGIVNPGLEYESIREEIVERLNQLIDPSTGIRAVENVYPREELYKGPMVEWAPDLIIEWRDTAYEPTESDRDQDSIFVTRWREYMNWPTSGSHRIDGIFFAKGPRINNSEKVVDASIIDMMPTWLRCLDQPVPSDLEGRSILELFDGH
jgi:predicted AlkP superfamily phosphohydrolase/phosphomutase